MRYQQTLITQLAYTSGTRVNLPVPGRVARWLLMYQDRVGPVIPIVQEDLAAALGIQRTYLSQALRRIETSGLIAIARVRITVTDRDGLIRLARGTSRPIGWPPAAVILTTGTAAGLVSGGVNVTRSR